jgi:hypothetical protein
MPIFNDPKFPKPGSPTSIQDEGVTLSRAIAKMRAEAEAARRARTYGSAAIQAPIIEPRIKSDFTVEARIEAIKPVPLKDSAWLAEMTQQLYNPYAQAHRTKAKEKAKIKTTSTDAGLYAAAAALVIAGALVLSTIFVQKIAERQIAKAIRKATASYAETAAVTFAGVNVSLLKRSVAVRGIQITLADSQETITIDKASVWGLDWPSLKQIATTRQPTIPKTMKLALMNVRANPDAFGPQGAQMLQAMGYDAVRFSVSADLARTNTSFDLKNLSIDARKMGRMNLSFSLGHFALPNSQELAHLKRDPKLIFTDPGHYAKYAQATIRGFLLTFEDRTITRRLVNFFDRMGEASPETLAQIALAMNSNMRDPASVDFVKPALENLVRFFQKPTTLTLTAEPSEDVPVLSLLDDTTGGTINELAHKLNLTLQ